MHVPVPNTLAAREAAAAAGQIRYHKLRNIVWNVTKRKAVLTPLIWRPRDPEVVTRFEWRMKLDCVQRQPGASRQQEKDRKCSAMKQPAQASASLREESHYQQ